MQKLYRNNLVFNFSASSLNWICEVCNFAARDNEDMLSIKNTKSCTDCIELFVDPITGLWRNKSKPTREVAHKRLNIFIEEV
jgi:hypothetical protein